MAKKEKEKKKEKKAGGPVSREEYKFWEADKYARALKLAGGEGASIKRVVIEYLKMAGRVTDMKGNVLPTDHNEPKGERYYNKLEAELNKK